jgi:hypothetical protein
VVRLGRAAHLDRVGASFKRVIGRYLRRLDWVAHTVPRQKSGPIGNYPATHFFNHRHSNYYYTLKIFRFLSKIRQIIANRPRLYLISISSPE